MTPSPMSIRIQQLEAEVRSLTADLTYWRQRARLWERRTKDAHKQARPDRKGTAA